MQWFLTKQFLKGCNLGEKLFLTTMTMINLYYHRHGKKLCQKQTAFFSQKKTCRSKVRRVPSVIIDYIDLDAIVRLVYCNKTALLMGKYNEKLIGLYCHVDIIL